MTDPATVPGTSPKRPRRRWPWILLGAGVVSVFLLPVLLGAFGRRYAVSALEDALRVRASLDSLSVGWRGTLELEGLVLEDEAGQSLARVGRCVIDGDVRAALSQRYGAVVQVSDVEVHARQDAEGRWNWADLGRASEDPVPEDAADEPLPDVFLRAGLVRGVVRIHGPDGVTEVDELELRLDLPALDGPGSLAYTGRLNGPGGAGGAFSGGGTLTLAEDGRIGPDTIRAEVETDFDAIDLASLEPAARLASALEGLAGRLDGGLGLALQPGRVPRLSGRIAATAVDLAGPAFPGGRFQLAELELEAEPGEAANSQRVVLAAGEMLVVRLASEGIELPQADVDAQGEAQRGASWWSLLPANTVVELSGDLDQLDVLVRGLRGSSEPLLGGPLAARLGVTPEGGGGVLDLRLETDGLFLAGNRFRGTPLEARLRIRPGEAAAGAKALQFEGELDAERFGADLAAGALPDTPLHLGFEGVLEEGALDLAGRLRIAGGTLALDVGGGVGEGARAELPLTLRLGLEDLGAGSGLAPLVAYLHPAFAQVAEGADVTGRLSGSLALHLGRPWSAELFSGGAAGLPLSSLAGGGRIAVDGVELGGSGLVREMLTHLGGGGKASLGDVAFSIDGGRLTYDEPWSWDIGGTPTTFEGSIGLDRTLDMTWSAPITRDLVRRSPFLKALEGVVLNVPVGGTLSRPELRLADMLQDLPKELSQKIALQSIQGELEKQLGGVVDGLVTNELGKLLGGAAAVESTPGSGKTGGQTPRTPAALLKDADTLWDAGKRAEARALYAELREKHLLTPVYLINKKRIDERRR